MALNVLSTLEGSSWTQCEDLDLKELESDEGLNILLKRLDRQWSYDDKVEMPNNFEAFFFKLKRRQQTLLEYTTKFHQVLRQVTKHKVDLPEEVTGWMMLKRAGLTREQEEQMAQTQIGSILTLAQLSRPSSCCSDRITNRLMSLITSADSSSNFDGRSPKAFTWPDEEGDEPELPDGTFYDDTENIYDTEEFDEVYSTYGDAKQRLNQLRQSQGFYPVVAAVDGKGQAPLVAQHPKGSAKGGKTKNKSKGKNSGSKRSSKGPTGKRVKAALTCLRCGKAGHFAANCPSVQQTEETSD